MKIRFGKPILFYSKIVLGILFACVIIRLFIGAPCTVPSDSMSPTILSGDRLWIDYTEYGARLPQRFADIPVINAFTWIKPLREADRRNYWGENRMKGRRLPQIGDVVVFKSLESPNHLLVKRISKIKSAGDTLVVNANNYGMMENLIRNEGDHIIKKSGKVFINGKADSVYRVKQPCYFMKGDHADNSHDSRHFGFIPHSSIVGKIKFVMYSFDNNTISFSNIRINRCVKKIH